MVDWYDPRQLAQTGLRALISSTFGAYIDRREIQSSLAPPSTCRDFAQHNELVVDFVADLGSGWNPTYAMAYTLAQPELTLVAPDGTTQTTRRGDVLVMGGDQVYPTATWEEYQDRLVGPYHAALPHASANPALFAIPGNHDWYDGLTAFLKLFCQQRSIGAWRTQQSRSYFAVELPHHWWLWGIDIQLNADIDKPQLDYFQEIGRKLGPDDRVMLCTAEPSWIFQAYKGTTKSHENLEFFCDKCLGPHRRPVITLSGDLHHYASYRTEQPPFRWKFTVGGGGAFTHPTHPFPDQLTLPEGHAASETAADPLAQVPYRAQTFFPSKAQSRRLAWRNLLFPLINWRFSLMMSAFCLIFSWVLATASGTVLYDPEVNEIIRHTPLGDLAETSAIWHIFTIYGQALLKNPILMLMLVGLLLAVYFFSDRSQQRKLPAQLTGLFHGLLQGLQVLVGVWMAQYITHTSVTMGMPGAYAPFLFVLLLTVVGGFFGSLLMGLYLLFCTLVLHTHETEAFSSLRDQDHKCFLRLHLTPERLTLYPIKVPCVPRQWEYHPGTRQSWFTPKAPLRHELIEPPIVIRHTKPD
ncbi:Calcineurin-like phosphoesterase [Catalinimonas alkaloidigena]|uniref:Calcineurin-like phosphoesterase n=2 Tax=Catalinimonas alkaloidigena TaxID=1075417 RepID=A0A1G9HXY0_9BACT|nr:Calcineurin-like phosphoesterase [Catalinimonas alkaloidigena]